MADLTASIQEIGPYGDSLDDAGLATFTAQNNTFKNDGSIMMVLENTGAALRTVIITGVPDPYGRSANITVSIAIGDKAIVGFLSPPLFNSGGEVSLDASANFVDIDIGLYRLKKV